MQDGTSSKNYLWVIERQEIYISRLNLKNTNEIVYISISKETYPLVIKYFESFTQNEKKI